MGGIGIIDKTKVRDMKKYIICSLAVLLVVVMWTNCRPSAEEKEKARVQRHMTPNPIVWDTILVNKTEIIKLDSLTNTSCGVNIKFIVPAEYENKEVLSLIQQELSYALIDDEILLESLSHEVLERYATDYIMDYVDTEKKNFSIWKEAASELQNHTKDISTQVLFDEANLISYQIQVVESEGQDTTSLIYENLLFDLVSGHKIKEEDIFRDHYTSELNNGLIEQLMRINRVQTVEELNSLGYWGAADIASNNNFYITTEGVNYTFNPGEYADVELGALNLLIDFDDLALLGILKDNSPISILYQKKETDLSLKK